MLAVIAIYLLASAIFQLVRAPRGLEKVRADPTVSTKQAGVAWVVALCLIGLKFWFGLYLLSI